MWLDKLDILPGELWDIAVERALYNCPRMLVILSPASESSPNVRDEVSFALWKEKTVIPVLYRDCEIPYRLHRLQRLDLRSDYAQRLKTLVAALAPSDNRGLSIPWLLPTTCARRHGAARLGPPDGYRLLDLEDFTGEAIEILPVSG